MVVLARFVNAWPLALVVGSIYDTVTKGLEAVTVIRAEVRQSGAPETLDEATWGEMGWNFSEEATELI
jgi:hypothetical protein